MEKEIELYSTRNFRLCVPKRTHIPRSDGGHLCIKSKVHYPDRTAFTPELMTEMGLLSMLAGEAYPAAMEKGGVSIARINYQENGNWAFRNGAEHPPYFHLHLYGRTRDSRTQTWGQALVFPDPDTGFYDDMEPLTEEDRRRIREELERLLQTEKYAALRNEYADKTAQQEV